MKPTHEMFEKLLQSIAATEPEEIDCDEWLTRVGRLIDIIQQDATVSADLAPVLQHIDVCPECREEFQLLLTALGKPE